MCSQKAESVSCNEALVCQRNPITILSSWQIVSQRQQGLLILISLHAKVSW